MLNAHITESTNTSLLLQFECCGLYDHRGFQNNASIYWQRQVTCFSRKKFDMLVPIACCIRDSPDDVADLTKATFRDLEMCLRTAHPALTVTEVSIAMCYHEACFCRLLIRSKSMFNECVPSPSAQSGPVYVYNDAHICPACTSRGIWTIIIYK